MRAMRMLFATLFGAVLFVAGAATAQEVRIRALGWYPNQPQTEDVERPFFRDIGQRTGGLFRAEYRSLAELNLRPFEHLRTLRSGAFDIMTVGAGFVSGDDPVMIGHDLPGIAIDFDEVRKVVDAWRPVLARRFAERHGGRLLAIAPFPPQIIFCRDPVRSLEDLRGKKIRVASAVASDLVRAMGGTAVTLAGPEVYPALQRGVVDCGATGSAFANANSWFEVARSVYPLPLGGYSIIMHVARDEFWNRLPEGHRTALAEQFGRMERDLWAVAQESHENGLRCNLGQRPCDGKPGSMTLTEPSAADREAFRNLVRDVALPGWFRDCERVSPTCRSDWSSTVGTAVGLRM